jgi:predicted glutamine amidotransferase
MLDCIEHRPASVQRELHDRTAQHTSPMACLTFSDPPPHGRDPSEALTNSRTFAVMCRLFGLSAGETPVKATFWLLDAPDSLRVQSHHNPDGTGLGYFDSAGRPRIDKQPLAAFEDRAFAHEARTVESGTFVGHIRFASTGSLEKRNTHPFEQQGRLFAHNGVVQDLPSLERRIGEGMDLVHGETDSERLFALITTEIGNHGGDLSTGVKSAVRWVAANLPLLSLNFVMITSEDLWALRYPDAHELHLLERPAGETIDHRSSQGTRIESEHGASRDTVVVASEVLDADSRWRPLQSGQLVHVSRTLEVETEVVIDEPPAHPLRLEDLEARARASQS